MLLGEKSMSKRAERDNYSRMCARREAARRPLTFGFHSRSVRAAAQFNLIIALARPSRHSHTEEFAF